MLHALDVRHLTPNQYLLGLSERLGNLTGLTHWPPMKLS
ncbi:Uncharacterised protein [Vibrio cholerae]|nr:Uncharacterised protein [Vibrio cholerae]